MKLIVAESFARGDRYCRQNGIPQNECIVVSTHDESSVERVYGCEFAPSDVVWLTTTSREMWDAIASRIRLEDPT